MLSARRSFACQVLLRAFQKLTFVVTYKDLNIVSEEAWAKNADGLSTCWVALIHAQWVYSGYYPHFQLGLCEAERSWSLHFSICRYCKVPHLALIEIHLGIRPPFSCHFDTLAINWEICDEQLVVGIIRRVLYGKFQSSLWVKGVRRYPEEAWREGTSVRQLAVWGDLTGVGLIKRFIVFRFGDLNQLQLVIQGLIAVEVPLIKFFVELA